MIKIRIANISDSDDILLWRNDELSRSMFINNDVITKAEHLNWYIKAIKDKNIFIYIGEKDHIKLGVVRMNLLNDNNTFQVSINLNPKMRGKGLSADLLRLALSKIPNHNKCVFIAKIKNKNEISKRTFKKCGFIYQYSKKNLDCYILK